MMKEKLLKVLKDNQALKLIIKEHNMDYHVLMKQKEKGTEATIIPGEDGGKELTSLTQTLDTAKIGVLIAAELGSTS